MNEVKVRQIFENEYNFKIFTLDETILETWLKPKFKSFYEDCLFEEFTLSELFFFDFFVEFEDVKYSIYFTYNLDDVDSFKKSWADSEIAKSFIKDFKCKQILLYKTSNCKSIDLDKVFGIIKSNPNKKFIVVYI